MHIHYGHLIELSWLAWALYWFWSARAVKTAERTDSFMQMLPYRLPVVLGFGLIFVQRDSGPTWLYQHVASTGLWAPPLGWLLVLFGLGFACWARVTLGRNWSGTVQLKQDHELIVAGPYRIVRHPIYTGMLLGVLGTVLAIGEPICLLAPLLIGGGFWFKLRHEEAWMRERFGAAYVDYMRRTKALIPGIL